MPWNPDTYTHRYERLAAKAGIEKPLKNLRHFNATELLRGGVDVATVADRLGHADGGVTTLRFYASGTHSAEQRDAAGNARKADQRRKRKVLTRGPRPSQS